MKKCSSIGKTNMQICMITDKGITGETHSYIAGSSEN